MVIPHNDIKVWRWTNQKQVQDCPHSRTYISQHPTYHNTYTADLRHAASQAVYRRQGAISSTGTQVYNPPGRRRRQILRHSAQIEKTLIP